MAIYTLGVRTAAPAANGFFFDIASSSTDRVRVLEIGLFSTAATSVIAALFRTTAVGTRTTPITFQAGNPADAAGTATMATAWSVAPTVGTIPLRRIALPAGVGAGFIWTFSGEALIVPLSGSIVLQAIAIGPISDVYVVIDE